MPISGVMSRSAKPTVNCGFSSLLACAAANCTSARKAQAMTARVKNTFMTNLTKKMPRSVGQRHDFRLADVDLAAGIVLLEGKMAFLEGLGEIEVFIQLIAIDGDLDARHVAAAPFVIADLHLIAEPRVGLNELLIDMA